MHLLRHALRHQVHRIFQWPTTSRDVKEHNANHIARESGQVKVRVASARTPGVTVEVSVDIWAAMWNKCLFIAALSAVEAVTWAGADVV